MRHRVACESAARVSPASAAGALGEPGVGATPGIYRFGNRRDGIGRANRAAPR
jgi:hypothetical protein